MTAGGGALLTRSGAAGAALVLADGVVQVVPGEVGPDGVHEQQFGVGDLPKQDVGSGVRASASFICGIVGTIQAPTRSPVKVNSQSSPAWLRVSSPLRMRTRSPN